MTEEKNKMKKKFNYCQFKIELEAYLKALEKQEREKQCPKIQKII